MSIRFHNDSAWRPMFDETIAIHATRPNDVTISGSFRACVLPIADVDPFAESDAASRLQRFSVLIARVGPNAWLEAALGSRPQIGDELTFKDGTRAAIVKTSPLVDGWFEVEARQC